jgi:hypothetical protein
MIRRLHPSLSDRIRQRLDQLDPPRADAAAELWSTRCLACPNAIGAGCRLLHDDGRWTAVCRYLLAWSRAVPAATCLEARQVVDVPAPLALSESESAELASRGMLELSTRYARAVLHWLRSGAPCRSADEIARINEICQPCDRHHDTRCTVCGCRVSSSATPLVNKIAMATEHCPEKKW